MKRGLSLLFLVVGCSSSGTPGNPLVAPNANITASPGSLPNVQSSAPQPTTSTSMPIPATPAPQTIQEAFGDASLFPVGFESVDFSWQAQDLIQKRPWVSNEGNFAPYLSYLYREAAYSVAPGLFNNQWLIDHKIFSSIEYHFQHDSTGKPNGPLHKVVFIFEVTLPKEATPPKEESPSKEKSPPKNNVERIREAASLKWGEFEITKDEFGLEYTLWKTQTADVRFYYSPNGSIPEAIEIVGKPGISKPVVSSQ